MRRLIDSPHTTTAIGFASATFGVFVAVCFVVGLANVLAWLAGSL
jgi:hypothetical protein